MTRERGWFVDTNVIVHVLRRSPLGAHLIDALQFRARPSTPMISVVTQAELLSLAALNHWAGAKRARLEELLNELVIVEVASTMRPQLDAYASLDLASHELHRKMTKNDLWIAASAASTESLLLTCDTDFAHLNPTHLKVWWLDPKATSWPSTPP